MKRPDLSERNTTHGLSDRPEYAIWCGMKQRCNYKKHISYHRYGEKGIKVCPEWNDFAQFLKDMGDRPDGMTLERIDSNGDYSKENCKWASYSEQMKNTSRTRKITLDGVTLCIKDWAEKLDVPAHRLYMRVHRGWSDEQVILGKEAIYA